MPRLLLVISIFITNIGCLGGSDKVVEPPPPPPLIFHLEISGAGVYNSGGYPGIITALREQETPNPIYWTLEGPGYLAADKEGKNPVGPSVGNFGWLWYIPPPSVSGGGNDSGKIYYRTLDLYNGGMKKSPELALQIRTLTVAMKIESSPSLPSGRTTAPGGMLEMGIQVSPAPFRFDSYTSVVWSIQDAIPHSGDRGSVTIHPIQNAYDGCLAVYTAPSTVSQEFDVTITATTHDPWFNLDPVLTWVFHVTKTP